MFSENMLSTRFLGSLESYDKADAVMVGAPMDYTCSFRPGTRFGPQKIREVSIGIEEYSVYSDKSLDECKYYDAGDINLTFGNVTKSLELIGNTCKNILSDNKFPIFIGGEHLISFPVIREVYNKYRDDLILLHFDAHADLRQDYIGQKNSHACVIRRVSEFMNSKNIYQFGIRSGTKEEFEFAKNNTNMYKFEVVKSFKSVIEKIKSKPVYVTLDIDVLDPAFANGTGTPEPGGCTSREIIEVIKEFKKLNLVGMDIVEVSPPYDNSDRTSLLAAIILREVLLSI